MKQKQQKSALPMMGHDVLLAWMRIQERPWMLIMSDWVEDHPDDAKVSKARHLLHRGMFPDRMSSEMTEEIDRIGSFLRPYTDDLLNFTEVIRTRAYLKSLFGQLFRTLVMGQDSIGAVGTLIRDRPTMTQAWQDSVIKIMRSPVLVKKIHIALGGDPKNF